MPPKAESPYTPQTPALRHLDALSLVRAPPELDRPSGASCHFDRVKPHVISTERSEWRNLECVRISCVQGYGFVGVFSCTLLAESVQKEGFPGDVYKKSGF